MRTSLGSIVGAAALCGIGMTSAAAGALVARSRGRLHRLRGKVAVITGGSRGLGLALAENLGRLGVRLVLAARDAEELQRAVTLLRKRDAVSPATEVLTVAADLRRAEDAERLIQEATRRFGRVDVLINNAGVITVGPIENQTIQAFHDVMDANFFSGLHCTLAVLPQMLERREGAIVNIASIGGKIAVPHLLPYTASKFAVVGFSDGLGVELRSKGIRVTTVCPGLMRTGSHRSAFFAGDAEREYRWFSLGASLPGISIAAGRAAHQIVDGLARGAAQVTITPQAFLISRLANVSPCLTRGAMGLMQLALPAPRHEARETFRGEEVRGREWTPATALGTNAALRYNQVRKETAAPAGA